MIEVTAFRKERVAVLGLARSGLAAARALAAGGAQVLAWDDAASRREEAIEAGIPVADLARQDLAGIRALVLSPGIPHRFPTPHPVAARARSFGIPIIGDIELLARSRAGSRFVGITGTNGKSTTTALLGHTLRQAGRTVAVGGNIGVPALMLEPLGPDGIYVLEMSSYQLELVDTLAFDVAILLNITPDHLDRHGGMEGYIAAKERIFARQRANQCAIVGVDDPPSRAIADRLAAEKTRRVIRISGRGGRLEGHQNPQDTEAALAAARFLGLSDAEAGAGIASFSGLEHRLEHVATIEGVTYVNDSKATNAEAVANALAHIDAVHWIAGGRAKEGGITSLTSYFPHLRHAYLIGEAAPEFARTLAGKVPFTMVGDLESAVAAAHAAARPHDTVLLSPACASFDQFRDFEARGERFRALVEALPGRRA
ncbi:MAG TPA: UDP-N-acetylmuramoyl-L-alanine--D-glutamate ligase [Stellaceae bacterium]|nr:UDP-N-acetylmuramoyl-L-alanine--D-glutamate ligase [Stellaceae bacterium]